MNPKSTSYIQGLVKDMENSCTYIYVEVSIK